MIRSRNRFTGRSVRSAAPSSAALGTVRQKEMPIRTWRSRAANHARDLQAEHTVLQAEHTVGFYHPGLLEDILAGTLRACAPP